MARASPRADPPKPIRRNLHQKRRSTGSADSTQALVWLFVGQFGVGILAQLLRHAAPERRIDLGSLTIECGADAHHVAVRRTPSP